MIDGACYAIPAHCTGLNPDLTCSGCLSNYTLSADRRRCEYQKSCNETQSCGVCPSGYYLYKGCCYKCSLLTNCVECGKVGCVKCADGYYLSNGKCLPCASNCLRCTSANVCIEAAPGNFVQASSNGQPSGVVAKCDVSCATCTSFKVCTTCASGYIKKGSQCIQKKRVNLRLVMKGNGKKNSVFKPKESSLDTLYNGLSSINRIRNSICITLPKAYNCTSYLLCLSIVKINWASVGSFVVETSITPGPFNSGQEALDAISTAFQTGKELDGT